MPSSPTPSVKTFKMAHECTSYPFCTEIRQYRPSGFISSVLIKIADFKTTLVTSQLALNKGRTHKKASYFK